MNLRIIPLAIICGIIMFGFLIKFVHIRARLSKFYAIIYAMMFVIIAVFSILSSIIFV